MKKTLLCTSIVFASLFAKSQCTPDVSETAAGIHPSVIENLAPATVGTPYAQTLTVIIPADTVVLVFGVPTTVPITNAKVTNVTGLPTGFTYACNVSACTFPGGTTNCAIITGTATAGQEGSYPVDIYVTYTAGVITADDTVTGYILNIGALSTFELSRSNSLQMHVAPNPFNNNVNVDFYSPINGTMRVTLYNLLGKTIKSEVISATTGENNYSLKGLNLPSGAYLFELNDGKTKVTKKLIKE